VQDKDKVNFYSSAQLPYYAKYCAQSPVPKKDENQTNAASG